MDPLKEAFNKIKDEILALQLEVSSLKNEIIWLRSINSSNNSIFIPTNNNNLSSNKDIQTDISAHTPALPQEIRGLYYDKRDTSTGNKGVPTDISADKQTFQQTDISVDSTNIFRERPLLKIQETLDSLDAIKKGVRLQFKRLTPQEMLVFSTIYSLENEGIEEITYKTISSHLNLTESSIRDYVTKILQKGIPISKRRLNNKKIILKISEDLKKIASLSSIIKLREL